MAVKQKIIHNKSEKIFKDIHVIRNFYHNIGIYLKQIICSIKIIRAKRRANKSIINFADGHLALAIKTLITFQETIKCMSLLIEKIKSNTHLHNLTNESSASSSD